MRHHYSKITAFFVAGIILPLGCDKDKSFPDEPIVKWEDHEIIDDPQTNRREIVLQISFTDGDGDIGRINSDEPYDTCSSESYNLLIRYFEKVEGNFEEIEPKDSCQLFHNMLDDIQPEGQNKTLEGDIFIPFSYLGFPDNPNVDSIKFEIQMRDRAGHLSNTAISPAIYIPPQ